MAYGIRRMRYVVCDRCGEALDILEVWTDREAYQKAKDEGWQPKRRDGGWFWHCPECQPPREGE